MIYILNEAKTRAEEAVLCRVAMISFVGIVCNVCCCMTIRFVFAGQCGYDVEKVLRAL